jgi:hypothetical protein
VVSSRSRNAVIKKKINSSFPSLQKPQIRPYADPVKSTAQLQTLEQLLQILFVVLFVVCGLFNDAVSNSDYITSNNGIINK